MIRIEFDESLRTGDQTVDSQHEKLIAMFNELHAASLEGRGPELVGPLLESLHDYTIEHFAAEQELMASSRFPASDMLAHVEEHVQLTQKVRDLIVDFHNGGFATILPLATLLQEWLTRHIRQRDRLLVEHLKTAGTSA